MFGDAVRRTGTENQNSNILSGENRYPQTIRDALTFTASMGIRYLWVDAVCIPLEPSQRSEQIRNMDAIYECAVVVIIAASSEHSDFGLHGVSLEQKPQVWSQFRDLELVFRPYDYVDYLAMSKWSTRGWCLQEGLLAQRRFILTDQEVFFECSSEIYHDSHADSKKISRIGKANPVLNVVRNPWKTLSNGPVGVYGIVVTSYLNKDLTRQSDILDAFVGIANSFNWNPPYSDNHPRNLETQSCWGLPCNYFGTRHGCRF